MRKTPWLIATLIAFVVLSPFAVAASWAQEKLDKYSLEAWGGTWKADCADAKSASVAIGEEALVFTQGPKRVEGRNFRVASGWFGNSPPENYVTALLSELPGEKQFLAFVYKDEQGPYVTLDGDPEVLGQIGQANVVKKYRRCDAPAEKSAPAGEKPAAAGEAPKATPATPPAGPEGHTASAMLSDTAFVAAYRKALGPYAGEEWLVNLDGPSTESKKVKVAKNEYLFINACKNHDCYDNNTVMLYSSAKKLVYGKVVVAGKHGLFGNPPPAVSKELETMWRAQWRSSP